jgi:hypothetical protein
VHSASRAVPDPEVVAPGGQAVEQSGIHQRGLRVDTGSSPNDGMDSIPLVRAVPYLDLGPLESRGGVHHGGSDVASDIQDGRSGAVPHGDIGLASH